MLLALVDRGMLRDDAYRVVQSSAMRAWREDVDFGDLIKADPEAAAVLSRAEVDAAMDPDQYRAGREVIFGRLEQLTFLMRAVRVQAFGEPDVLQLEEVADPRPPGAGEVLVRLHAAGVNPVEAYMRAGQYAALPPLPYTPGSDGAGVVEAVGGGGAPGPAVGDRVYTSGSLTGHLCRGGAVRRRAGPPASRQRRVRRGRGRWGCPTRRPSARCSSAGRRATGELVLVRGASGGVGMATVQFAVGAGLTVHGTAGSEAAVGWSPRRAPPRWSTTTWPTRQASLALSDGRGYDVVVEMAAHASLASTWDCWRAAGGWSWSAAADRSR